ncbi:MAG TPA: protein translocase subunit SecD [Thermoanaerobaculia bacterium]|nr:protein translocase subunit SecD [Thermoanaerobaculia bacterium]
MKGNLLWRGVLILAILVTAALLAWPPEEKINLGLDLRGGMHLVLQVETEDALRAETDSDMDRLVQLAEEEGMAGLQPRRTADARFEISGLSPQSMDALADLAEERGFTGRGGTRWEVAGRGDGRIAFEMNDAEVNAVRNSAVSQARQTIDNRINAYGVAEPVITTTDDYRIVVQLPGVDDPDRVRNLIKSTAFLEFRIVENGPVPDRQALLANYGGRLPDTLEILEGDVRDNTGKDIGDEYYAVQKRRTVTGRDLKNARPSLGEFNRPVVQFMLTPTGSDAFGELTGNNIGKPMAIVLDGRIASVAVIRSRITDEGVIEGDFTQQEVQDLSTILKSGALPAGITTLEERTVGASLGRDSIEKGILSGLVGTSLVVLYMLIIYNLSGLNAVMALALNVLLLFGGLAAFDATLTLPGIAGIILTIGMAVDANVLVFERIREELRAGRTVRSSIDLGFQKALSSIIDGNVTTLIAAAFLFQFGTGPIRGFAVTLFIGLLASMFTAVFVSRWVFDFVLTRWRVQRLSI